MRKLFHPAFVALLTALLTFVIYSCNSEAENDSSNVADTSLSYISEAELPKGKQVIEDDAQYPNNPRTSPIVPVSGPKKDKTDTNSSDAEPTSESRTDKLKKVYKNLLVFHADDTMEVKKSKLATLILARNESVAKLKTQVLEESNAKDDKLKMDTSMDFGSKMKARLIPFGDSKLDNSFEIELLGNEEQSFRNDRKKIIWQWKITPLKEGQHELKLSIQIIEKDGEEVYLPARNIPVVIFAKKQGFMTRVGNFFAHKYEWILTAIFLPVFIAWFTSRIKNRNNRPT